MIRRRLSNALGVLAVIIFSLACQSKESIGNPNSLVSPQRSAETPPAVDRQLGKPSPYFLDYPVKLSIDGERLRVLAAVMDNFRSDKEITNENKDLSKYDLEMRSDDEFVFVTLTLKKDADKIYVGGDIVYFVSKKDGTVVRTFSK